MRFSLNFSRRQHVAIVNNIAGPSKVKVGFPRGKTEGSVVDIAIWNHYGTRGGGWGGPIPARPFLLQAMRTGRKDNKKFLRAVAKKLIRGETTLAASLPQLGVKVQGDIQESITALRSPANSPVTVRIKGSSNPLIDTGRMRQAVTWVLED